MAIRNFDEKEVASDDPLFNGEPIDTPPRSLEEGREEQAALLDQMRQIDAQLGQEFLTTGPGKFHSRKDYDQWRRRAVDARRHVERRYRFVKGWVKQQGRDYTRPVLPADVASTTATAQARALGRRIGAIEAVAIAAAAFVRSRATDDLEELVRVVEETSEKTGY